MKREIIIFAGGVVVGFLLFKVFPVKKVTTAVKDAANNAASAITGNTNTTVTPTSTATTITDEQKMTICEAKLEEAKRTIRFGSVEEMHSYNTQFIADCMDAKV